MFFPKMAKRNTVKAGPVYLLPKSIPRAIPKEIKYL